MGANGSGKSSILRLASGLLRPSAGTVQTAAGFHATVSLTKHGLNPFVSFRDWMTIRTPRAVHGGVLATALELEFDAEELRRPIRTLSDGALQRLRIAVSLPQSSRSGLLLMDEPTSHLDILQTRRVTGLLQEYAARGVGMLCAATDVAWAIDTCDRLLLLRRGRLHSIEGPGLTDPRRVLD